MNEREIMERLQRVITDTPIDLLETLQQTDVEKMEAHDRYTEQPAARVVPIHRRPMTFLRPVLAAAMLFLVIGAGWFWAQMPVSTLYVDINPSVSLTMNRMDRVKEARAYNTDGEALLASLDLNGLSAAEALSQLDRAVPERGVTMVSVDAANEKLQAAGEENAQIFLSGSEVVLRQAVPSADRLREEARRLQISPGKLELIRKIIAADSVLNEQQLAAMTLEDILTALSAENIDIRTLVDVVGDAQQLHLEPQAPVEVAYPETEPPETEAPQTEAPSLPVEDDDDWDDDWDDDDWDDDDWDDDWDDDDWDDDDWDDDWDDDDWDDDDWDDDDWDDDDRDD